MRFKSTSVEIISAQLVVSVVSNAPKITDLASISDMQQMTSSVCDLTVEGYEKQLKDTRDGNYYYVGKMKDGKCWMLQNLALGSTSADITLTSADSNITSNWTLPAVYTSTTGSSTLNTAIQSWIFGKWVLATPLLTTSCGNVASPTASTNCIKVGFVDVSNTTNFKPTYTATTGTWDGATVTSNTLVAVNCTAWSGSGTSKTCTAGTYDAHYLVGNWYSWNAATAGSGGALVGEQASESICPKGWRLPTGGASGELRALTTAYGVNANLSGTVDSVTYNIAGAPLRLVRSGNVALDSEARYVVYAGQGGSYWSATAYGNSSGIYRLSFTTSVNAAGLNYRYNGQSVRCLAE